MEFKEFRDLVQQQFDKMAADSDILFLTGVDKDVLWDTYMESFPEGMNVLFRERRAYDCQYCRQFLRPYANIVAIKDNKLVTIWDFETGEDQYQQVADMMSALVKTKPVANIFVTHDKRLGTPSNKQMLEDDTILTWHHFSLNVPRQFVDRSSNSIESTQGHMRQLKEVFKRGLDTITMDAISDVLDLIESNSLYRGEEYRNVIQAFEALLAEYNRIPDNEKDNFAWSKLKKTRSDILAVRNSAIGTLLVDLSEGKELERAVASFEKIMAPANYKRPTALITQKMIQQAQQTVQDLGLMDALGRRYAVTEDLTVNNVLFANKESKVLMNAFDELAEETPKKETLPKQLIDISIEDFMKDVLPRASNVEVLVEGKHESNLMSLIAPISKEAEPLFSWENGFSWAYNGDVTDSIKQRVKAAGGKVDGYLRCSLSWFNYDDLDIHLVEPNGNRIYYSNKRSRTGGELDIDMNAGNGTTREAVENITYPGPMNMVEGVYKLQVHNYSKRESKDVGFDCEIEFNGEIHQFHYKQAVKNDQYVDVAEFYWSKERGIEFINSLERGTMSKEIWGVKTNQFRKVNMIMHSPNHWDDKAHGNKHYFFMLDGCKNEGQPRGFFNEFLRSDLREHRKVFEALGTKMAVQPSDNQLSGIGFSSTQRNSIIAKVQGEIYRTYNIHF